MNTVVKKILACAALAAVVAISTGAADQQQLIEETYTVRPGDTLWSISEDYLQKNTGGRRYILDFKYSIQKSNPWLQQRPSGCEIYPGDQLKITYWVKE